MEGRQETEALPPMEVRVRTNVRRVIAIGLQAQTFTAVVKFEASWIDQELKEVADNIAEERKEATSAGSGKEDVTVSTLHYDETLASQAHCELVIVEDQLQRRLFTPRLRLQNLIAKDEEEKWFEFYESEDGLPSSASGGNSEGFFIRPSHYTCFHSTASTCAWSW